MRVMVGADDEADVLDAAIAHLTRLGHEVSTAERDDWPDVALKVSQAVATGDADMGLLMCWSGTGTAMMANKVDGIRAALCWEPWIADGARRWNDANVLVMSLKRTPPERAVEIIDAWLAIDAPDQDEVENIDKVTAYEAHRRGATDA